MSPFAHHLRMLRVTRGLRQSELATIIGYEQSYVSALELGLKGPPNEEFVQSLSRHLQLGEDEKEELYQVVEASQRRFSIPQDVPAEVFWLCHRLAQQIHHLHPAQISLMETALNLPQHFARPIEKMHTRIKRRSLKTQEQEAKMK